MQDKISDISVDALLKGIEDTDDEAKAALFDRLVKDILIDHPIGKIFLEEAIERRDLKNRHLKEGEEPLPNHSAIMIAFKMILLGYVDATESSVEKNFSQLPPEMLGILTGMSSVLKSLTVKVEGIENQLKSFGKS